MTGSGTQLDPYVIWDVNDLQDMNLDLTAYYELGQDINAAATVGWNAGAGFDPVGSAFPKFTGEFNGMEYAISDLFINRVASYIGLFGWTDGAIIENARLVDVNITAAGGLYVAGLIGYANNSTIRNCSSSGSVTAIGDSVGGLLGETDQSEISYSNSSVTVIGYDDCGGLVGLLDHNSTADNCYATGNVSGEKWVGGFAGEIVNGASATLCYATGDVSFTDTGFGFWFGGFAGITGIVSNCFSRGNINAVGVIKTGKKAGGFAGGNVDTIINSYSTGTVDADADIGGLCSDDGGTITNCFWDTETSGRTMSAGGTGKTTAQMKQIATFFDSAWDIEHSTSDLAGGYPFLAWQVGVSSVWLIFGAVVPPPVVPTVMTLPATGVT